MRKVLLLVLLVSLCGMYAVAQDQPKGELGVGYDYMKADADLPSGSTQTNSVPAGFFADGTYYFTRLLGLTGDFEYHHKSFNGGGSAGFFSFHGGPRVKGHLGKAEPFAHALLGITHVGADNGAGVSRSDSAFSIKIGGGLDVAVARHFAIRLAEANYYMTKFGATSPVNFNNNGDTRQNNFTFGAGIVIR
jgi:opacity protein-like surface antigen